MLSRDHNSEQEYEVDRGAEMQGAGWLLEELEQSLGSRCEVKTKENAFLCMARSFAVHEGVMTLVANGGRLPMVIYNTDLKILLRRLGKSPLVFYGQVCGSNEYQWRVDRLRPASHEENREYFRQIVSVPAELMSLSGTTKENRQNFEDLGNLPAGLVVECQVMDVSLEGLRFRSAQRFERGGRVMIRNLYLTGGSVYPFVLLLEVRWVSKTSRGEYMCGCRFLDISSREQDALCTAIFTLQREELKAQTQW